MGDADNDAALGRAVELRDGQRRDLRGLNELLGLLEGVLTGRAVQNEENFVRSPGHYFLHHVLNLGQLVH